MTDDPIGEDVDDHRVAAWIATTTGAMLVDLVRHQDYDRRWGGLEYEGDRRAHHMIVEELARLRPRDMVLSEEGRDDRSRLDETRAPRSPPRGGERPTETRLARRRRRASSPRLRSRARL